MLQPKKLICVSSVRSTEVGKIWILPSDTIQPAAGPLALPWPRQLALPPLNREVPPGWSAAHLIPARGSRLSCRTGAHPTTALPGPAAYSSRHAQHTPPWRPHPSIHCPWQCAWHRWTWGWVGSIGISPPHSLRCVNSCDGGAEAGSAPLTSTPRPLK